jgi:hypothetical protein
MGSQPIDADCELVVQNNDGNSDIAEIVESLKGARFKRR